MYSFNPDKHEYAHNGVKMPSVTTIIEKVLYPNAFDFVDPDILEQATERGNRIHKAVETGFTDPLTDDELDSYNQAMNLLKKHNIEILKQEQIIYSSLGYMGKYDIYAKVGDEYWLIDMKTGNSLNKKKTAIQQSFYKLAWEEMGNRVDKIYAMHLPKNKVGRLVDLPIKPRHIIELLVMEYNKCE